MRRKAEPSLLIPMVCTGADWGALAGGAQPHSRHEAIPSLPLLLQLSLSPSPASLIKPKHLITTC